MTTRELWNYTQENNWLTAPLDTQWKWKVVDTDLIICFQCTSGIFDWIINFTAMPAYTDCGWKAHTGFLLKWKAVRDEIKKLMDIYSNVNRIYITGHSQGGAIAQFCNEWIRFNYDKIPSESIQCQVFGSPKILYENPKIDRFDNVISWEHNWDIVTWLPPFAYPLGVRRNFGSFSFNIKKNHFAYKEL